jgi:uncharacterized protein (TIGR02453 family)
MARGALDFDLGGAQTPHFEGFGADAFAFFADLAANQNRDWFTANKARYEAQVRAPFAALVADLSAALAERDIPFRGDPKTALFRIHRDVRFSNDKSPYKTNAGAVLSRGGMKGEPGMIYVHISPEGCFAAAGYYHPEPKVLANIRRVIAERPSTWREILAALDAAGVEVSQTDKLTRTPRGFEAVTDADLLDALKLKSFMVRKPLGRDEVGGADLVETLADFADQVWPIFRLA